MPVIMIAMDIFKLAPESPDFLESSAPFVGWKEKVRLVFAKS